MGKVFTRSGASWSESTPGEIFVRDGGQWKEVKSIFVRRPFPSPFWDVVFKQFIGFLRPDLDVETTDWSSTPLFEKLDEVSPDDATTEITADFSGSSEQVKDFEIGLSNPVITPTGREVVTMRVRSYLEELVGSSLNDVTMELKQGAVVKATISEMVPSGYITEEHTLSQAEKDSITDWDDLRVRVEFAVT